MKKKALAATDSVRQKEILLKRARSYILRISARRAEQETCAGQGHVLVHVPLVDFLRDRMRPKFLGTLALKIELRSSRSSHWFEVI